jgi:lipopolysaccharide biosynthesis protein
LKYIAFYLSQFYPIPENNAWWGNGFTEWTNVTKAQPQFPGHYQPHLPADFGFYDLRVREVQHEQIVQAKRFAIDAFCFHYYWFAGRRLLERPLEEFLNDEKADIEFCLCWANENWTRGWDGAKHEVLMEQTYLPGNDIAFIESVLPYFRDPRYLRVNGAPVLVLYRPQHLPNASETAVRWRQHCRDVGIGEIHLVAALTHGNRDFEQFGFDAGVEFPPHNLAVADIRGAVDATKTFAGYIAYYEEIARALIQENYENRRVYRGVFPSWDNTARRGERAFVAFGATPEGYERWLTAASHLTSIERAPTERLVFINAWNEWAEGCHLEPDQKHGFAFLEATRRAKSQAPAIDPTFDLLSGGTLGACGVRAGST